jgi:hypothetical protein
LAYQASEAPLQFGEIIAASTMPDFAGLPLEFWPGYQRATSTYELRAATASDFSRPETAMSGCVSGTRRRRHS